MSIDHTVYDEHGILSSNFIKIAYVFSIKTEIYNKRPALASLDQNLSKWSASSQIKPNLSKRSVFCQFGPKSGQTRATQFHIYSLFIRSTCTDVKIVTVRLYLTGEMFNGETDSLV